MRRGHRKPVTSRCKLKWLRGEDLTLRPLGYEPNELPGCSTPRQEKISVALCPALFNASPAEKIARRRPDQWMRTSSPAVNSDCQVALTCRWMKHAPLPHASAVPSASRTVAKTRPSRRTPTRDDGHSLTPPPPPAVKRTALSRAVAERVGPSTAVKNGRTVLPYSCSPPIW